MKISLICMKMNMQGKTFSYEWFHTKTRFDTEAYIKPPSPHYLSFSKMYFLLIISIHSHRCRLRESRHQSLCDASVCAFQVFDRESFAVTVRHYCLQPKNFDSNI